MFKKNNTLYEGIFEHNTIDSRDEITGLEFSVIDKKLPFTSLQASGIKSLEQNDKRNSYMHVSGYVDDPDIRGMLIFFKNGLLVKVFVNPDQTYSYTKSDMAVSIEKIIAIDQNNKELYVSPPYPPKKL